MPSDLFKRDYIFCRMLTQEKLKIAFFCGIFDFGKTENSLESVQRGAQRRAVGNHLVSNSNRIAI